MKAVTAAQLSMASQNVYSVTLDEAIEAMRLTAVDMSVSCLIHRQRSYYHEITASEYLCYQGWVWEG